MKPRNEENGRQNEWKVILGGLGLFWSSNRLKCRNAVSWASEHKHLWNKPGCYEEYQNGSRPQGFLGFILPQNDQKCTFYAILSSNFPSGCYEGNLNWIFAPTSILSLRMTPDPREGAFHAFLRVFSSFLGFILPKNRQEIFFSVFFRCKTRKNDTIHITFDWCHVTMLAYTPLA